MDIEFNKHACAYASVHIFLLRKILILCDLLIYFQVFLSLEMMSKMFKGVVIRVQELFLIRKK